MSNPIVLLPMAKSFLAKMTTIMKKKSGRADRERWERKGRIGVNPVSRLSDTGKDKEEKVNCDRLHVCSHVLLHRCIADEDARYGSHR